MLAGSKEVTHAPKPEVRPGDLEAIVGCFEDAEARGGFFATVGDQDAEAFVTAAADPAAELMEL
jgi:hypothetical protein